MAELIREYTTAIRTPEGERFSVSVYGTERVDGTWEAWLEFSPVTASSPVLRTERETSQPNRGALEYWADGLEPVYLEGAFARAQVIAD